MTQTLVLFDIDGTLLHTLGAGVRGMNTAFERLHGHAGALDGLSIAGRTDLSIVGDAFRRLGVEPTTAAIHTLRDAYFDELRLELGRPREGFFGVLPGVHDALAAMEPHRDLAVGLLTGNFVTGAEIKLGYFDLWDRFAFGAFGDDHIDRRDLVPVAVAAARSKDIDPGAVVVIGDTPRDIDCAHAHGGIAVAVATGPYRVDQLSDAELVIDSLEALTLDRLFELIEKRRT